MKRLTLTIAAALLATACAHAAPTGDEGFTTIFNGTNLDGWDGQPIPNVSTEKLTRINHIQDGVR